MKLQTFVAVFLCMVGSCSADNSDDNPFKHTWVLDKEGNYVLDWLADFEQSRIYFNVTVKTRGYVGFGLSKKGLMLGADMIIGGVRPNGTHYFADRHGVPDHKTEIDPSQDWDLHSAWESSTHTFLSFSRPFETCDKAHDLGITNDLTNVIWAYGERDIENEYHYGNRDTVPLYLLDPDLTPNAVREQSYRNVTRPQQMTQLGDWKVWSIPVDIVLPPQETTYMCTFHKAPTKTKQHVVGFRVVMGELEKRHIHHFILHICHAPKGVSPEVLFGPYVGQPGEQCYVLYGPQNRRPTQYCQETRHAWAVGAEPIFFPEHVGLPLSEAQDEYYMLQIHYDNPQERPDIRLQYYLEAFYTNRLRKYDVGLMYTGLATPGSPSIVIPPSDTNHVIYGHCSADCTRKIIPESGINVFGSLLHTHETGKGVRALHIQNLQEYAFSADDNYDFDYQPIRLLRNEETILPGDMIVSKCTYDTTNRTGVTVGNTFIWYYPSIRSDSYPICSGEIRADAYRNSLQIFQTTWSDERREEVITSPPHNAGLTVSEAMNRVKWDINMRTQLQTHQRFLPQVTKCPSVSPEAVTQELLRQTSFQGFSRLGQFVKRLHPASGSPGTFSDIQKEIQSPGNEFVSLWPKDLSFYSPPTICPK